MLLIHFVHTRRVYYIYTYMNMTYSFRPSMVPLLYSQTAIRMIWIYWNRKKNSISGPSDHFRIKKEEEEDNKINMIAECERFWFMYQYLSTGQRKPHKRHQSYTLVVFFILFFLVFVAVVRYKSGSLFGFEPRILLPYTYDDLYLFALFGLWTELLESTEVLSKSKKPAIGRAIDHCYTPFCTRAPASLRLAMCGWAHMYSFGITELNQCGW